MRGTKSETGIYRESERMRVWEKERGKRNQMELSLQRALYN